MPLDTTLYFDLETAPLAVSHVTLIVQDLDRVAGFYQDIIGLQVLSGDDNCVTLGTIKAFLTLCQNAEARRADPRDPGLFHTAFLLPDRQSLSSWLAHAIAAGVTPYGASDHNVSEAVYLDDPEGNGIEVYVDRPVAHWNGASGTLYMPSHRLDLSTLPEAQPWGGAPDKTRIGHVHLQTPAIPEAEAFWTDNGFDVTARYPGGSFFGAGGYHHQIAANVWQSAERPVPEGPVTGLQSLALASEFDHQPETSPSGIHITFTPKGA
jgi:catechol 2,3-dioxygenase